MHVLITGAGIAGLAAAVALRHHGIEVTVLEQARRIGEIGAGIQIASNGTVVMRELGLEDAMRDVAVFPQEYDYRDMMTGRKLYEAPLGEEAAARYGAPLYHIHRADLIGLLIGALPEGAVRLDAKVTGIEQDAEGVRVVTRAGESFSGDALIGADGIHSSVREHLFGADEPLFTGILMWRSLIPAERLQDVWLPERGNYWFGPGRTLVTYWVRPQQLYSVVASVPAEEIHRESWSESGDVDELYRSFSDVEPRALAVVEQIDKAFITGMYHREPATQWGEGRVSLIGDAAHPMVPFLAQGACQGIEDAWTLARVLDRKRDDVAGALREYEERRRPRTTRMQAAALAIVKLLHEPDPDRVRARNGRWKGMSRIDPLAETSWKFAWGYNVLESVEKAPGEVMGLTGLREGKHMTRPESQRAFELWKGCFTPADVAGGHDGMRLAYDRFLTSEFPPPEDAQVEAVETGGVPALRVMPVGGDAESGPVVLHFHGGGYMIGSARGSLEYAHRLAATVGGSCVTVDYRLAPEHPYPAALDDATDAYRGLLKEGVAPARILLSGESSGGGLALALALLLRTANDPLPAGIVVASPFTDLSLSGESIDRYSGDDPAANRDSLSFMAASYFQGHEPTDPYISPVFGDLAGLPPLFVTAVRDEVLASDAMRLIERARAAGVAVTEMLVKDSVHVFPVFPFLPETEEAMAGLRAWSRGLV